MEFEYITKLSGAKLEYDYIIGKIINKNFIILGVFDAKISIALIQNDISKFSNGIQMLMENKLSLRYVFKKKYNNLFNQISSFKDDNNTWKKFDYYPNQVNTIPLQKSATDISVL